jgi:peptide/nickel transport system ATP-binding protein
MQDNLISIRDLSISFGSNEVVKNISFDIENNQILALVGESGSGKSLTALSLIGLLPKKARVQGQIVFENQDLLSIQEKEWQQLRSSKIAMIFQEPMTSLNPSLTCGYQVEEVLREHTELSSKAIEEEVLILFNQVKLPRAKQMLSQYPHQLSGGQKQRVMIAMALACNPSLILADEPTTALDVTVQKEILELLKEIQKEREMSILFISHDLALVSEFAEEVMVMYKGEIVETGCVTKVFKEPEDNYTKALINARPHLDKRIVHLPTVSDFLQESRDMSLISERERSLFHEKIYANKPILQVQDLSLYYGKTKTWLSPDSLVKAIDGVDLNLYEGETLGLVGESGCGKSTLGRAILGLEIPQSGSIFYKSKDITNLRGKDLLEFRKEVQIIFQDPYSALNPRLAVGKAIMEPMKVHGIGKNKQDRKNKTLELLDQVGLDSSAFDRYPHEFSGGQRQRICIARTIAVNPRVIICDESVSALDVSVQAQVLNLLNELKRKYKFTYIFISHDLAVVKYMSDQLLVMRAGKIEEHGEADAVYSKPGSPYTQKLINSIPKGL